MQTSTNEVAILWASYFDELAATSFSHEFGQMGVPVTLVMVDRDSERQRSGILPHSRQGLKEIIARAEQITCLVIPASIAILAQFEQDPLLWQMIETVYQNGGRIVMARSHGVADPEIIRKMPPLGKILYYPAIEKVLLFARWLTHSLVVGEELGTVRSESLLPPLVKVAAHSDPGGVAGAMAGIVREYGFAEAQAVGSAAVNQMMKATAVAKSYLSADKLSLYVVPNFASVVIGGQPRSAIRLFISAWPVGLEDSIDWEQADLLVAVDHE